MKYIKIIFDIDNHKMKEIIIQAYAKLNLDLEIKSRLPNSYHTLRSVFQAIDLFDTITITKYDRYMLTGSMDCDISDNLVTKAKICMEELTSRELACHINLQKSIPICAGMGGGSSDAAATMISINELFGLDIRLEDMIKAGSSIGSDIPFFLYGSGTALVEGIGDKISALPLHEPAYYLVARPHVRVQTKKMYELHDKTGKSFQEIIFEKVPDTLKMFNSLHGSSHSKGISGSGPTFFAQFADYRQALAASETIRWLDGDIYICQPVENTYRIISRVSNRKKDYQAACIR